MELNWLSASETDEWKHKLNIIMCRKLLNVVNGQSPCLFYQCIVDALHAHSNNCLFVMHLHRPFFNKRSTTVAGSCKFN